MSLSERIALWTGMIAVGLTALAVSLHAAKIDGERAALAAQTEARLTAERDSARDSLARARATVVHDSIYLTEWRTRYVAIHDTVLRHVTDTLTVERFVAIADSTIHACQQEVLALTTTCALEHRQYLLADSAATFWKLQSPSFWQRHEGALVVTTDVVAALAGFALGRVSK